MAFPAKWPGKCKATGCGGSFAPGEMISRLKWGGFAHAQCVDQPKSKKIPKKEHQMYLVFPSSNTVKGG